jgi:hypothetical protein
VVEAAQLDIFIPLQRSERLHEWARLGREHDFDLDEPGGVGAFADWLRQNGHAPAGLSHDAVTLLVAVMRDYERPEQLRHVPA